MTVSHIWRMIFWETIFLGLVPLCSLMLYGVKAAYLHRV